MGKFYRKLNEELREFILKQKVFFTGTAPMDGGRINVSPKGYDSLALLSDSELCYIDFPGSGNETANHLEDNGRITIMWCAFEGKPLILRVYAYGEVVPKTDPRFDEWASTLFSQFDPRTARQIFYLKIEAIQTSCGYGVPFMDYQGEREALLKWADKKVSQNALDQYIEDNLMRNEQKFPLKDRLLPAEQGEQA